MSAVGWWERVTAPLRRASTGFCTCDDPLTDAAVDARGGEDPDWCWRCRKPIDTEEDEDA